MKKISIITINYNDAAGLEKTIKSVIDQTSRDFEYIVIDGGSTDESLKIIESNKDKLSYWVSEADTGRYNAMNKGILKASGEYCLFLNSGDYLHTDHVLQDMLSFGPDADIVYGNMLIDFGNGKTGEGKMPSRITLEQMYLDTLWHPVSFIKRALFQKYGLYNEAYKMAADYDFFFNTLIMQSVSQQHVDQIISVYNLKGLSSLPENKPLEKSERLQVLQSHLPPAVIEFLQQKSQVKEAHPSFFAKLRSRFS